MTQVQADLTVEQDYDSNVTFQTHNPGGSPVTFVRPAIRIENTGTVGHGQLEGWLSDHTFWDQSELDGTDRGVDGTFDRMIFPRFSVFGSGSYQRLAAHAEIRGPTVVTLTEEPGLPTEPVITAGQLVEGAAPNLDLGQGEAGVRYLLTPRSQLSVSGGPFSAIYLNTPGVIVPQRDRTGWFASGTLDHALSSLDKLSVELAANSTDFSSVTVPVRVGDPFHLAFGSVDSGTSVSSLESLSLGWTRTWSEVWTTSVSVGGRRLETQTRGAPTEVTRVGPGGSNPDSMGISGFRAFAPTNFDDVGPGLIGAISVQRNLPRGSLVLSYSRETRTTSSVSTTNVDVDSVSLYWSHRLSAHATVTLNGAYEHYVSANSFPQAIGATYIPNSFNPITGPEFTCFSGTLVESGVGSDKTGQCEISSHTRLVSDLWTGSARLDWQLRKRFSTFVVLRFADRSGDAALFGNDFDKWTVGIGFHYNYALGF